MCDKVETAGIFSGRTKRTTDNIYEELLDVYKLSTELWTKINAIKEEAKDGKNFSYYETPGRNLMKQLMDLHTRESDLMKKMKTAYAKEIAEHVKRIESEQAQEFQSVQSIRDKYKAGMKQSPAEEDDLIATVAMVRDLMSMRHK